MAKKITLLQMVLACESEVDRIGTWEIVLSTEGKKLDPGMDQRRLVYRKMAATLEIVMKNEHDIRRMLKEKREEAA